MDEFEKLVSKCQRHKINRDIENSAWVHALTLFKYLLKEAAENSHKVSIVTGSLNNDFYNELYDLSKEYLSKLRENNIPISIIILKDNKGELSLKSNKFAEFVEEDSKNSISYTENVKMPHFILIGNDCYRFETDHEHTKAFANFNDTATGKILENMFINLKDRSKAA